MKNELTPEEINVLREYINTESGAKLLLKIANQELTYLAIAYNDKTPLEKQGQLVNKVAGMYWVRTLIQDLVTPKK